MAENASLTNFIDEGESKRPPEEAAAIAGNTTDSEAAEIINKSEYRYPASDGTIDIAVMQVNYTIEGRGDDQHPVLHVFGRTADNETEHVRVREFRPYFYAPTESLDHPPEDDYDRLTGSEDGYESIRGQPLTKVFGRTPPDVGELRDHFDHYEADILFPNRLLIDKNITSGIRVPECRKDNGTIEIPHEEIETVPVDADLRINTFDIEVDDRNGFPEDGEEPIVCLTSHDSYDDQYTVWLYESPTGTSGPDELSEYDPHNGPIDADVRSFESEEGMLAAFIDYIEATDPDVLTGWNFTDFDMPYLVDRLKQLGGDGALDPDRLSRVNEVWLDDWYGPNVKGRVVFDLLDGYKRTQFTELESYRLDAVGEVELGIGKERYPGDIGDLWEDDPERLLEYNLRDVELCVELDRKQGIIPFWEEVATFVGCKLEDAITPGDAVDLYILHKVHGDLVLPSKGSVDAEDYEGGAVFEPITGVKEMVSVLDLKSLYPMAMVTINASPETKVSPEYDGDVYEAPNGTLFRKEPDGIIREMVNELLSERDEKKTRRDEHDPGSEAYETYDRQQSAVKVLMNSLYGVLGWERFRLYDMEMGAAVTATGREVIKYTEEAANKHDKDVVYGDTDSVMIEFGQEVSKAEAINQSFELAEQINEAYEAFAGEELNAQEHRFEIEFEKLYRRFFQAGRKKRYAGHIIWKEGKDVDDIDITGFEYKRSDIAPITKEVQREVIELIVTSDGKEYQDAVADYVHDVIEGFQSGEISVEEVGIPGGIGKRLSNYDVDRAHVRGAKYANAMLGTNFARGSKPKRIYLDRVHPDFFTQIESEGRISNGERDLYTEFKREQDVICIEYADQLPDEFSVEWDEMLDKTLKNPIERILEAIGISWDEVKTGQQQTGLGQYS
ncbi:DNA-directed DNA polymerase [Halocatena pleomorpha]|uniref:DNA polymerase n=1 Tax=Halocatena pleomorpha TaxID=1785090 RepID=A0A3P3R7G6_9EURY|nr:DNA-directed DNA polymerase [Halocatena pleomorpha]RRJ29411.1 DNA polymerase elongation subunit [Halocatena pleomorpha]